MLQMQGKGTRKIVTRHGSLKRGEVLESTGEAEGFIMLAGGPLAAAVIGARLIPMKALHHQACVMVRFFYLHKLASWLSKSKIKKK